MLRYLRAMAWLRWRVMLNSARPSRKRDTLEWLSRVSAVLTPILLTLVLLPSALGVGVAGFVGGLAMASNPGHVALITGIVRGVLLLSFLAVLLAPLVRTIQGSHVGLERLMLLPIPRRMLHLTEYLSGLTDPWVAIFIPGILALPLGLLVGGAFGAAVIAGLAAVAVLAALAGLGSVCSFAALLVFRVRRRAELVTLVVLLVLSTLGFIPILVEKYVVNRPEPAVAAGEAPGERSDLALERIEGKLLWVRWAPSELYGVGIARAVDRHHGDASLHLLGLTLAAGLLYWASGRFYDRLLETPESGSGRGAAPAEVRSLQLPGVGPATAAIASAVFRTSLRTVRGKLAVFFTPAVIVFLWFAAGVDLAERWPEVPVGPFLLLAGAAVGFLSLQPILHNQLAVDGSGLTLQFLVPVSEQEIAAGKILGNGLLAMLTTALCALVALVLSRQGHPAYWASMLLSCVAGFALLAPVCTMLSATLPKSADLSRMGKAGNPHPVAGIAGVVLTPLTLLPPLALTALGMFAAKSPWLTLLLAAAWSALSLAIALPLTRAAAATVARRRENLLLVATGR